MRQQFLLKLWCAKIENVKHCRELDIFEDFCIDPKLKELIVVKSQTYLFSLFVEKANHLNYKIGRKSTDFGLLLVFAIATQFRAILLHFFG